MLPVGAGQKHAHAQVASTIPPAFSPGLRGLLAGLAVAAPLISFETKIEQPPPDVEQLLGPTQRKRANSWNASFFNGSSLRRGRIPPEILRLPGFLAVLDRDLAARPPLERTTGNPRISSGLLS